MGVKPFFRQSIVNEVMVPMQTSFLEFSHPSWYREADTLTNGHFLYKCKYLSQKSYLYSVCCFCVCCLKVTSSR